MRACLSSPQRDTLTDHGIRDRSASLGARRPGPTAWVGSPCRALGLVRSGLCERCTGNPACLGGKSRTSAAIGLNIWRCGRGHPRPGISARSAGGWNDGPGFSPRTYFASTRAKLPYARVGVGFAGVGRCKRSHAAALVLISGIPPRGLYRCCQVRTRSKSSSALRWWNNCRSRGHLQMPNAHHR